MQESDYRLQGMLKEALAGEKMAESNYQLMQEAAPPADRESVFTIACEENRHFLLLQSLYHELFGVMPPEARVAASMPQGYRQMLKTSICDELEAVAFYGQLADELKCLRHKELICFIINDEKNHARILSAIYRTV